MNAWRWWWCFLLIFPLGNTKEIYVHDEEHKNTKNQAEFKQESHQHRQRRDSEWLDDNLPTNEEESTEQLELLINPVKRKPILTRWGGKRLSDYLYYKRKPAFSSWGGKRGPAFSSWGGKRSGNINMDENHKILKIPNNSPIDDNDLFQTDFSESEKMGQFPSEDDLYEFLQDKYYEQLSNDDIEKLERIFSEKDHPPGTQRSDESEEQEISSLFSQNGINDSNQGILKSLNLIKGNMDTQIKNDRKESPEQEGKEVDDLDDTHYGYENDIESDFNIEHENITNSNSMDKKASPSFNSWGGKRVPAFNSWGGKRAPAFNSWGGKRVPASNSWSGKRVPAFNSWGGKRAPAFNSWGGKRAPAFNSWGGKRALAFNSWGGKRATAFNSWGGKRAPAFNSWGGKRAPAFNSWGGKRMPAFNSWGGKRYSDYNIQDEGEDISDTSITRKKRSLPSNTWKAQKGFTQETLAEERIPPFNRLEGELENSLENSIIDDSKLNEWLNKRNSVLTGWNNKKAQGFSTWDSKRAPAFNSWGGKRVPAFNSWGGKRAPAFNSWGGKRATAFNSWGGKRAPAFNSWGGKRAPAFNSWGGKRAPAFNSWGGKRVPAFNSWGGKRATAFNSWGGKRAPAFNSWGGKRAPAFNSWGGKRAPAFNSWGGKRTTYDGIDNKWGNFRKWKGKRLPAFHSWGGKRSDTSQSDKTDNENNFLDMLNSDNSLNEDTETDSTDEINPFIDSRINPEDENIISHEKNNEKIKQPENKFPFLENYKNLKEMENESNKSQFDIPIQGENFRAALTKDRIQKRNAAFFSWGGKRNEIPKLFLEKSDLNTKNDDTMTQKDIEDIFEENNLVDHDINKRDIDLRNTYHDAPDFQTIYAQKHEPIHLSWDGKESQYIHEEKKAGNNESPPTENNRKKRNVASNSGKSITLITDNNNFDNIISKDIDSFSSGDIFSDMPTGTMMCCIKRVQYGDRNLFMQMLLRTKSFRDLSWPTIRPIRRGSDFYPWGGKRSSL